MRRPFRARRGSSRLAFGAEGDDEAAQEELDRKAREAYRERRAKEDESKKARPYVRYWPRRVFGADGAVAPVLYGYPRACATVVAVAIVHLDPAESGRLDELRLQPTDTVEVSK